MISETIIDFILLGYALNGVAFVIAVINTLVVAIYDFNSIIESNNNTKRESHFWKIIIPYYIAYRIFALYAMYGVKHGFNIARMIQAREKHEDMEK